MQGSPLEWLDLGDNDLSELPRGLFEGLSGLAQLRLDDNPGAPFTFTAELEQLGNDAAVVKVAQGAPVDMAIILTVHGGTLSTTTVSIDAGSLKSSPIIVSPSGQGPTKVTVDVTSAQFPDSVTHFEAVLGDGLYYTGIQTGVGPSLSITLITGTPATGAPAIVSYSYQWISNDGTSDTDIANAADSTYTLAAADEGKTIKARVSFTDDAGNDETLTSAPTAAIEARPNSPATGDLMISDAFDDGVVQVGHWLLASLPNISDADGLTDVYYRFQWMTNDGLYEVQSSDVGRTLKVRVSFTDDAGNEETLISEPTDIVVIPALPNSPATGSPTINIGTNNGAVEVGHTLNTSTTDIADADGLTGATFSYRWFAGDGITDMEIAGATEAEYTIAPSDVGLVVGVRVSFTDDAGNQETLSSESVPVISSTAQAQAAEPGVTTPEDAPSPNSYVTVVAAKDASDPEDLLSRLTVTWNDAGECTSNSNAYLIYSIYTKVDGENRWELSLSQVHLGSAAPDGVQVVKEIAVDEAKSLGGDVKLFCGDDVSGRLVSAINVVVGVFTGLSSTFTSESELDVLIVSHGTVTPVWIDRIHGYNAPNYRYIVPDVANGVNRITVTAIPKPGRDVDIWDGGSTGRDHFINVYSPGPYGPPDDCQDSLVSGDGNGGRLYELVDADEDAPGFQVDLEEGENRINVRTTPSGRCEIGAIHRLTITRAGAAKVVPAIIGTARVGETLTADTTGIADTGGQLVRATFGYQWISNDGTSDTDIANAADSTYTLATSDESKTIKVRVTFNDDAGYEETLTSAATASVAPEITEPPAAPQNLTAAVNEDGSVTLTWDPPDDETVTGYQILRRDLALHGIGNFQVHLDDTGNAAASYIDRDVSPDGSYVYRIKARNAAGLSGRSNYFRANTPAEPTTPATNGTAQVGETLTADTTGIADADGLNNVTFSYQWVSDDGINDTDITGATTSSYIPAPSDEGKPIKVRVSFTDDAGNVETLTSAATAAVVPKPNNPATGAPAINGTAQVGETLTADTTGIADADGLNNVAFGYQWVSNDGFTDTYISGTSAAAYTLTSGDEGNTIKVRVSFTDDRDNQEVLISAKTAAVVALNNPTIGGTARVGETLTADTSAIDGALSVVTFSYQWVSNDGLTDTDHPGATGSTYTLTANDEGKTIKVRVSFTVTSATTEPAEADGE